MIVFKGTKPLEESTSRLNKCMHMNFYFSFNIKQRLKSILLLVEFND